MLSFGCSIMDVFITVVIQVIFMRDLEKLISSWRVVIIYIGSNICGSLASATFLPYYVEVSCDIFQAQF